MDVPIVGQKRLYVNAASASGAPEESKHAPAAKQEDVQMRGLQDIIRGLESQKRMRTE